MFYTKQAVMMALLPYLARYMPSLGGLALIPGKLRIVR